MRSNVLLGGALTGGGVTDHDNKTQRIREGVPVDAETWNEIRAAAKLKLEPDRIDALARG